MSVEKQTIITGEDTPSTKCSTDGTFYVQRPLLEKAGLTPVSAPKNRQPSNLPGTN